MKRQYRVIIACAILFAGVATIRYLIATKPSAKKSALVDLGTAVEIITVGKSSTTVTVRARGTVLPSRQVTLGPEVGGKIIRISPEFQPGGHFLAGDIIAKIDPSDYRLAVEQQFAMVDSAQTQLEIEQSRKRVAEREWSMFQDKNKSTANKQLALREPQLRSATVALKSAKSGLKRARLSVERTLLRAPFEGRVQSRYAELGQMVAPGTPLLSFVGTNSYWVQVSIPVERLAWISIPGVSGQTVGSDVKVHQYADKEHIEKKGTVLRLLPDVDPAGRMARILVEIRNPLGPAPSTTEAEAPIQTEEPDSSHSKLPLLLGSYVEVEITGRKADDVIELSRGALRDGNKVFLMTQEGTLKKRKVEILWRQENKVLVASGLKEGDRVVVSPLSAAIDGMKLRVPGEKTTPPETPPDSKAGLSPAASASSGTIVEETKL